MAVRKAFLAGVFVLGASQDAFAVDCQADMADAHARIAAIQARDPAIDALVKKKDIKGACAILRTNVKDMTIARDAMAVCLAGFDKNEEVSALNAKLADLSDAIAAHCV